jgi:hypothetical protein
MAMTRRKPGCVPIGLGLPILLAGSAGCDALVVRPFAGTIIQLTLSAAAPTPSCPKIETRAYAASR